MKRTSPLSTVLMTVAVAFFSFMFGFTMTALVSSDVAAAAFDEGSILSYKQSMNIKSAATASATPAEIYADLSTADWYYDGAEYCIKRGLIAGYSDGNFYPDTKISRAMFTLTLWNIEGYPFVDYDAPFIDVTEGQWYTPAIKWAASAGIVNGCGDGTFRPDTVISREDLATIAWRYLKHKDAITAESSNTLDLYKDSEQISDYAAQAMRWAHESGILIGTSNDTISPADGVSRAQFAVFMARYAPPTGFTKSSMLLEHTLKSIEVQSGPSKTEYAPGEIFDPTGMVVIGHFADGTTEILEDYTVTPTTTADGKKTFTVSCDGVDTDIPDTIVKEKDKGIKNRSGSSSGGYSRTLTRIAVTTPPTKTTYNHGDAFDATGMVVTATYTDGSSETVTGYTVSPTAMVEGVSSVTVSFNGYGDQVAVTIGRALQSIAVTTPPAKTTYNHGDAFDATGMVVTATYTDGSSETVTGFSITPALVSYGDANVTITFDGKSCTTPVTINRVLASIAVTTPPAKTTYNHGDAFDATGMVVTATYTEGGSAPVTGYTAMPDPLTYGTTVAIVSYGGFSDTTPVTVNHVLASIAVTTQPTKTDYDVGEIFDPTGMVVTATYTDGDSEAVTGYTTSPTGALALGMTSVTVTYELNGVSKSDAVAISVDRIALATVPSQSNTLTYDGTALSPKWDGYDPAKMSITGSQSETNAGTYTVSITPGANYKWPDGSATATTVSWTIGKASFTATVSISGYTYAGTKSTPTVSENPGGGIVTYYGKADISGAATAWDSVNATTYDAGTRYCYAVIAESDNYLGYTTPDAEFTIGKATISPSIGMSGYTYAGTKSTPTVSGNIGNGAVTYYYNTTDAASGGTAWSGVTSASSLDAGTYYIYAVIAESANYQGATTSTQSFTIAKATLSGITVSISGYTYAGTKSTPTISSNPGGGIVTYYGRSTASGAATAWNNVNATTYDAGTRYCYATITGMANYNDFTTPNASFSIAKATPSISISPTSVSLDADHLTQTATVTTNGDGTLSVSSNATGVATASINTSTKVVTISHVSQTTGTATITVSQAAGTNYNAGSCTVQVNAQFAPAWTDSSVAIGSVITMGTFRAGATLIPPASEPYNYYIPNVDSGVHIYGNIAKYNSAATYSFGDSVATPSNNLKWVKLSDAVLICDRCLLSNVSCLDVDHQSNPENILGNTTPITVDGHTYSGVTIDGHTYRLRLIADFPEWNTLGTATSRADDVIHWSHIMTVTQYNRDVDSGRLCIGGTSFTNASYDTYQYTSHDNYGFRPVLELIE